MNANDHWATPLIGASWWPRGRGPDRFDCWTLVVHVYKKQLNIHLSEYSFIARAALNAQIRGFRKIIQCSPEWVEKDKKKEFDLVLLSRKISDTPHHCGLWTKANRGSIVHCCMGRGVVCDRYVRISQEWHIVGQYEFVGYDNDN